MPPAKKQTGSWSDPPHDLLSVFLDRLAPAYGDRVRFRGVCQAWRAAELAYPHPPMPWLVRPEKCVSLHDASIHRVPLPEDAAAAVCRGSFGNWLALVPPTGRSFLLNAFTMERIKLPRRKKKPMVKFVLSSAPDSESCTVAAIVDNEDDDHENIIMRSKIVVCSLRQGRRQERRWRTITRAFQLHDIIFFEGKLHALHAQARVHVFQDGDLQPDKPWSPPENIAPRRSNRFDDRLHLVALHGRLLMVGRAFGKTRVPGCTHFTCAVGVFALVLAGEPANKRPQPVKDLDGYAIFIGDACCDAFAVGASSSTGGGGKIRENQICFVDDEKNLSSLTAYCLRPFRQLQSFDVRNGCLRTYRPPEPTSSSGSSGTWRCVTVQRFPHSRAIGPPVRKALSEAELRLWEVTNCLGATRQPSYTTHKEVGGSSRVTVCIRVPKTSAIRKNHAWSCTQRRSSAREARQAAAHEAATFLRSRFRSVLDDSPWSSVPHYHSHVDEEDQEEKDHSDPDPDDKLFEYKRWYGDLFH
ncbi:unnamed protein product [Alopecurus aequalis]